MTGDEVHYTENIRTPYVFSVIKESPYELNILKLLCKLGVSFELNRSVSCGQVETGVKPLKHIPIKMEHLLKSYHVVCTTGC